MADRKHLRERPTAEDDTWPSLCPCPTSRNAENTTLAVDRQEPTSAKTSQPACFCLSPCGLETDTVSATTTLGERVSSKSRPDRGMLCRAGCKPECGPAGLRSDETSVCRRVLEVAADAAVRILRRVERERLADDFDAEDVR